MSQYQNPYYQYNVDNMKYPRPTGKILARNGHHFTLTKKMKSKAKDAKDAPDAQLETLRTEFDAFKNEAAAKEEALSAERDALAKELATLKEQQSTDASDNSSSASENDMVEEVGDENAYGCNALEGCTAGCEAASGGCNGCEVPSSSACGAFDSVTKSVADQFDEDGYLKVLLP